MGLMKVTTYVFRFTCDAQGCGRMVEFRTRLKREALRHLRYYGWQYRPWDGRIYCNRHRR